VLAFLDVITVLAAKSVEGSIHSTDDRESNESNIGIAQTNCSDNSRIVKVANED
jgi:hypothetical protein